VLQFTLYGVMTCMLCPPRVLKPAEVVLLTENTLVSVGNTILLTCIGGTMLMQVGYKLSLVCTTDGVLLPPSTGSKMAACWRLHWTGGFK